MPPIITAKPKDIGFGEVSVSESPAQPGINPAGVWGLVGKSVDIEAAKKQGPAVEAAVVAQSLADAPAVYAQSDTTAISVVAEHALEGAVGVSVRANAYGVTASANANGSGNADGGIGLDGSSTGFRGIGVYGSATDASGTGVKGIGPNVGVWAESAANWGLKAIGGSAAVVATTLSGSATSVGVRGQAQSGIGVQGITASNVGVEGIGGTHAGWFEGDVNVTGNCYKTGGGFRIDHPLNPGAMYLSHSFVESSDMKNLYDGVAVLGPKGDATVQLPKWFEALNGDYRYQLTPIGGPAPDLHIASEVSHGRFRIAGGAKGLKVSWQVTGVRQDAWAKANRIQAEEKKVGPERGKYRHPGVHGKPEELSVYWGRKPELLQKLLKHRKKGATLMATLAELGDEVPAAKTRKSGKR